jgi:hypothetical protein
MHGRRKETMHEIPGPYLKYKKNKNENFRQLKFYMNYTSPFFH